MKTTAKAHPIQGLIKYHGMRDEVLRLPYHDSISVCCGPTSTVTTVQPDMDLRQDTVQVDGQLLTARGLERARAVLDRVRQLVRKEIYFKVVSCNDFPSNIGLGASSSAFAALAAAACWSQGLNPDLRELSRMARLGAGSASRSVTGGFSKWLAGDRDEDCYAYRLDNDLEMDMIAVLISHYKQTEDAHKSVLTSPFFQARLNYIQRPLEEMEYAIKTGDVATIGRLAEADTMNLHGITMTSVDEMLLWEPETLRVIKIVKQLRAQKVLAYFSIDTGATVYINTIRKFVEQIRQRLDDEGFQVIELKVAPGVQRIEQPLF